MVLLRPLLLAAALSSSRALQIAPLAARSRPLSVCAQQLPNIDGSGSLRTLVTYPARMDIKAIGETVSDESFVDDMKKLASEAAPSHPVEVRWRDKGRFRSVTMRCTFRSADEVYALYASLDADKRVKFKL